jgi:hypothetical protein
MGETGKKFQTSRELWVNPCGELFQELGELIGTDNVKLCEETSYEKSTINSKNI